MLAYIFDNKILMICILLCWLVTVMLVFSHLGIMKTSFMSMGPSEETIFMDMKLNTWFRWGCVAVFTFVSTSINDFASDSISPWIQNTLQDHKNKYLPYSKLTCWSISQFWSIYCSIMSVFSLFLMMSQVDFLIIRAFADTLVNSYTTWRFIHDKTTNKQKYEKWKNADIDDSKSETETTELDVMVQPIEKEG